MAYRHQSVLGARRAIPARSGNAAHPDWEALRFVDERILGGGQRLPPGCRRIIVFADNGSRNSMACGGESGLGFLPLVVI